MPLNEKNSKVLEYYLNKIQKIGINPIKTLYFKRHT